MGFKLKTRTMFPALVTVQSPLLLSKIGISYSFSIDVATLASSVGAILTVGTASAADTGTSGHKIPFLDGANTWSAKQIISLAATALPVPSQGGVTKTNVAAHFGTTDGSQGWLFFDNYGNSNGPSLAFRSGRGTAAARTATQSGDSLFNFYTMGYGTTVQASFGAVFGSMALENWTDTAQGSAWYFYTNTIGAASITERVRIATGLMVGTTTDPGVGAIAATTTIKSSGPTSGIGYGTGAGGAVTQGTSRTTGVTLDKVAGAITLFAAAPAVGTWVSFTVTNSAVAATDVPIVSFKSGTNTYIGHVTAVAAGSFQISFTSIVGTASDSPVINFAIIKAVAA